MMWGGSRALAARRRWLERYCPVESFIAPGRRSYRRQPYRAGAAHPQARVLLRQGCPPGIQALQSVALNSAATLRLVLMLAEIPGLADTVLALASHEAALACSAVGAS